MGIKKEKFAFGLK